MSLFWEVAIQPPLKVLDGTRVQVRLLKEGVPGFPGLSPPSRPQLGSEFPSTSRGSKATCIVPEVCTERAPDLQDTGEKEKVGAGSGLCCYHCEASWENP